MEIEGDLLSILFPIHTALTCIGYAPYTIQGIKEHKYVTLKKKSAIIWFLIHLPLSFWSILICREEHSRSLNRGLLIVMGVGSIFVIRNLFLLSYTCLNKYNSRRYIKVLNRLYHLSNELNNNGIRTSDLNRLKLKQYLLIVYAIAVTATQFICINLSRSTNIFQILNCSIYLFGLFVEYVHSIHYFTITYLAATIIREARVQMCNKCQNNDIREEEIADLIRYVSVTYLTLCKTYNLFSRCLSVPTLFLLAGYTSTAIFNTLSFIITNDIVTKIIELLMFLPMLMPIGIFVTGTTRIHNEVKCFPICIIVGIFYSSIFSGAYFTKNIIHNFY